MRIIEQEVSTILRPTNINLAPFVINPYQGCELGCCFCYAQFSKVAKKQVDDWGDYVKVKINALDVLAKELDQIKPESVLIGSITECFQPIERKYNITKKILELLNYRKIPFTIMSRSSLIVEHINLLSQGNCKSIYFTVNVLPDILSKEFNMNAPNFAKGLEVVKKLQDEGINIIAYFCPVLPWISDIEQIVSSVKGIARKAEFEIINFYMAKHKLMEAAIEKYYPEYSLNYQKLLNDAGFLDASFKKIETDILAEAGNSFERLKVHVHEFKQYFRNKY